MDRIVHGVSESRTLLSDFYFHRVIIRSFPDGSEIENLPAMQETQEIRVQSLGREETMEKEMATHSSIVAYKIPWAEKPGRLQSIASQRVRHD